MAPKEESWRKTEKVGKMNAAKTLPDIVDNGRKTINRTLSQMNFFYEEKNRTVSVILITLKKFAHQAKWIWSKGKDYEPASVFLHGVWWQSVNASHTHKLWFSYIYELCFYFKSARNLLTRLFILLFTRLFTWLFSKQCLLAKNKQRITDANELNKERRSSLRFEVQTNDVIGRPLCVTVEFWITLRFTFFLEKSVQAWNAVHAVRTQRLIHTLYVQFHEQRGHCVVSAYREPPDAWRTCTVYQLAT